MILILQLSMLPLFIYSTKRRGFQKGDRRLEGFASYEPLEICRSLSGCLPPLLEISRAVERCSLEDRGSSRLGRRKNEED